MKSALVKFPKYVETGSDRISEYRTTTGQDILVLTLDVIVLARNYIAYWENNNVAEKKSVRATGLLGGTVVIDARQFLKIVCRAPYQPPNEA